MTYRRQFQIKKALKEATDSIVKSGTSKPKMPLQIRVMKIKYCTFI